MSDTQSKSFHEWMLERYNEGEVSSWPEWSEVMKAFPHASFEEWLDIRAGRDIKRSTAKPCLIDVLIERFTDGRESTATIVLSTGFFKLSIMDAELLSNLLRDAIKESRRIEYAKQQPIPPTTH